MPSTTHAATVLPLALILTTSTTLVRAQDLSHASHQTAHPDPSEIAPTVSTWKGAIADSLRLLLVEHTTRIAFQHKTRRELGGSFFGDYRRALKTPHTWDDGDSWGVNYVGHPIHGAAAGFIWLDHEDGSHDPALGFSREYWASRGRATAGRPHTACSSSSGR